MSQLPVIDISALVANESTAVVAQQIKAACCQSGFFYITGHGVDTELQAELERLSRKFFALDLEDKKAIRMELGGRAWRGYFAVGDELTSGRPDMKEGIYFGSELPAEHPRVAANTPLHGANLFPAIAGFRETILAYLSAMTQLGHTVMRGIAASLDLEEDYFRANYTEDPTILFRIFHYPSQGHDASTESFGVGEHTDYGLLTILRQDDCGGLQVKSESHWIDAPPISNSFVCNIGDMLDRMSGGFYRSTPHRVKNQSNKGRLSFPFFFDPNFDAVVKPVFPSQVSHDRWDGADLQQLSGTYGEYLLNKVAMVFPELGDQL